MSFTYNLYKSLQDDLNSIQADIRQLDDDAMNAPGDSDAFAAEYKKLMFESAEIEGLLKQNENEHPSQYYFFSRIPNKLWRLDFEDQFDQESLKISTPRFDDITATDLPKNTHQALTILMVFWPSQSEADYTSLLNKNNLEVTAKDFMYVSAALNRVDILDTILNSITPDELINILEEDFYIIYNMAIDAANIKVLEWLKKHSTDSLWLAMLKSNNYSALYHAYRQQNFTSMEWLINNSSPADRVALIESQEYGLFDIASIHRDLRTMQWVVAQLQTPEEKMKMISVNNHRAFQAAAFAGRIDILEWLFDQCSTDMQKNEMISANDYGAYRKSFESGQGHVAEWLLEHANDIQRSEMQSVKANQDFQNSYSVSGDLTQMETIFENASAEYKQTMLNTKDYQHSAFQQAMIDLNLGTMQWLIEKATPEQKTAMIELNDYKAFRNAASAGRLDIMQFLYDVATPEQQNAMVASEDFEAYKNANSFGHDDIMQWLDTLEKPLLQKELSDLILSSITSRLSSTYLSDLKNAIDNLSTSSDDPNLKILQNLNISAENQQKFIEDLTAKYNKPLSDNAKKIIQDAFLKNYHALELCSTETLKNKINEQIINQNKNKVIIDKKIQFALVDEFNAKLENVNLDKARRAVDALTTHIGDLNEAIKTLSVFNIPPEKLQKIYSKYVKKYAGGEFAANLIRMYDENAIAKADESQLLKLIDSQNIKSLIEDAILARGVPEDEQDKDDLEAFNIKVQKLNYEIKLWASNEFKSHFDTLKDEDVLAIYGILQKLKDHKNLDKALHCLAVVGISEEGMHSLNLIIEKYGQATKMKPELQILIENALAFLPADPNAPVNPYAYVPSNLSSRKEYITSEINKEFQAIQFASVSSPRSPNHYNTVRFFVRAPEDEPKIKEKAKEEEADKAQPKSNYSTGPD